MNDNDAVMIKCMQGALERIRDIKELTKDIQLEANEIKNVFEIIKNYIKTTDDTLIERNFDEYE